MLIIDIEWHFRCYTVCDSLYQDEEAERERLSAAVAEEEAKRKAEQKAQQAAAAKLAQDAAEVQRHTVDMQDRLNQLRLVQYDKQRARPSCDQSTPSSCVATVQRCTLSHAPYMCMDLCPWSNAVITGSSSSSSSSRSSSLTCPKCVPYLQ